ncbi:MAG: DUF6968 family protein [Pseudolabrys sp.]
MTPIATCELKTKDGTADVAVPVSIFAPQQSEHGDWACRYEIGWPEKTRVMNAAGIDAMQALLSALQMIGTELYTSAYHKAGRLYWDEPGRGYGFPVPNNLRDLLEGDDQRFL